MKELEDFIHNIHSGTLLIIGDSQTGKTSLCLKFLKNSNFTKAPIENFKSNSDFISYINNIIYSKSISNFFDKRIKIIFIDDLDILMSCDRNALSFIIGISKLGICKFICTCNSSDERKLNDLIKICNTCIYLNKNVNNKPHSLNSYSNMDAYAMVHKFFINHDCNLSDIDYFIANDAILMGYLLYDNFIHLSKTCFTFPNTYDGLSYISSIFCHTCLLEEFSFYKNDFFTLELLSIVRCLAIRLIQHNLHDLDYMNNKSICDFKKNIIYSHIPSRIIQHCTVQKKCKTTMSDFIDHSTIQLFADIHICNSSIGAKKNTSLGHNTLFNSLCSIYLFNIVK